MTYDFYIVIKILRIIYYLKKKKEKKLNIFKDRS